MTLYECPFPKIRIGNNGDGGYVVANHISSTPYDLLLGAGVGPDISFEIDFCKKFPNVPCVLFDGTVEKLLKGQPKNKNIQFIKKNIGPQDTNTETNLHSYIDSHNNIFLKIGR